MGDSDESVDMPKGEGKIQRSLDVKLRKINVTEEEKKYREENFDNVDLIKDYEKYLVCTRCDSDFRRTIKKGGTVMVHPLLGVLMCSSCCDYFGDGDFSMDSEGEDKYCRWCGDGGTIFVCSKCNFGFCDACINKHFKESGLEEVKNNDNWNCYFCNPKPLWYLRSVCSLAEEAAKNKRDCLKRKEGRRLKKKRRKKGSDEDSGNKSVLGTFGRSSDADSTNSSLKHTKRRRSLRKVDKVATDESSSSDEDELENEKKKRPSKSRKQSSSEKREQSSDTSTRTRKKRTKISRDDDFQNKKHLLLEKLKSIWKLTESVLEAGLTSSREKVKHLSKKWKFGTLESLKREHEDLKSCIGVLATSINSASNSVYAIKDDLTFDSAKNESDIIQRQEMKLKRFAKKFQKQSQDETSADSDGNSSQNELREKKKRATGDAEKEGEETGVRSDEGSEGGEENERGKNVSEGEGEGGDADDDKTQDDECDSGKEGSPVKPLLKVKSFARMLNDNVYDNDNDKNSGTVDVYDVETDDSENERQTNEGNKKESPKKGKEPLKEKKEKEPLKEEKEKEPLSEEEKKEKEPLKDKEKGKEPLKEKEKEKVSDAAKEKSRDSSEDEEIEKKSESESEQEKENNINDENVGKGEKKMRKKKKEASETENEETEEIRKNLNQEEDSPGDEDENAKETVSGGEERPESESGDESEKEKGKEEEIEKEKEEEKEKEKENENSSHESEKSSEEEELSTRRTRNAKKGKPELKASFEKFKRKRERYLRSTKEPKSDEEKVKETKVLESSESESDAGKKEKLKNWRPRKKRVLASSDEENGEEEKETKSGEEEKETKSGDEESSDEAKTAKSSEVESEKENQNGKSDAGITSAPTSEEEFDTRKRKRIRKRKKRSSESGEDEKKKKRRRTKGGSSDSSGDEENKKKNRRRNIKKILKKDSLQVETKEALKNEEERKKRLKEKQKLFEELFPEGEGKKSRRLILDFDPETKEPLVTIHKKLAKRLKPHQLSGVKFMWDNCFESVQKLEEESGSGCILAHCMGLGKTLQVVTLVHTVMTHDLGVQSVLIVCPLSTVSNWIREFEMWLENIHTEPITLFDLVRYKKAEERRMYLEDWHRNGGVLVLSYDLFRNLTKSSMKQQDKKKKAKKIQMTFGNALLDPGPDLVVCDEGHLLKNEDTALSKCMSRLKTARRIILTGTPLQNNLIEYHCMVQFVKPNILGTRKEFCNRFVNPINNGQFEDSTELDVKIMKRRSHVLHSMLEGCIQRFDYSVLTPFLPEKHEYVLQIALTDTQAKMYLHFIKNLSAKSCGSSRAASLFNDYHSLQRIWTHPRTLLMQKEKENQKETLLSDSEGSLRDFVVSSEEETSESGSDSSDASKPEPVKPRKRVLRSNAHDPEVKKMIEEEEKQKDRNWWDDFYDEKAYDDLRESNKLVLLFALLKYCSEVKDKVLVFSQSLYSLDLIEYFLARVDENSKKDDETLCGHQDTWILGSDYFRLDGSTSSETRRVWCKTFNKETNSRGRLFLISTRAGGLGINLYGANRVIIFDASWNPSHDLQSIFRVYRFGQKKPCYIYRFLAEATMEEKIYERQVTKLSLAHRVVDEHQIERHYTMGNLQELYNFEPTPKDQRKVPNLPKDSVLADLLANHKDVIVGYHEHDSLLENKQEEELSEEERKAAWKEYEEEKVQRRYNTDMGIQYDMSLLQQVEQQFLMKQQLQQQGEGTIRFVNPIHMGLKVNPKHVKPIYFPPNIPMELVKRGLVVGMTPLPKETPDSFMKRVIGRETWLNAEVIE